RVEYELEYGKDALEIHVDAIRPGQRVLIVDDLLATGGTMEAAARLVEQLKGQIVGFAFLIELAFLKGRERLRKLGNYEILSLVTYEEEPGQAAGGGCSAAGRADRKDPRLQPGGGHRTGPPRYRARPRGPRGPVPGFGRGLLPAPL